MSDFLAELSTITIIIGIIIGLLLGFTIFNNNISTDVSIQFNSKFNSTSTSNAILNAKNSMIEVEADCDYKGLDCVSSCVGSCVNDCINGKILIYKINKKDAERIMYEFKNCKFITCLEFYSVIKDEAFKEPVKQYNIIPVKNIVEVKYF